MDNNQMMNQVDEEVEIDFIGMLLDLWRKMPLILLVTVFTAIMGFVYSSFFITPMYKSSTKMYVLSQDDTSSTSTYMDLQIGTLLTSDYAEMIKSRYVMETVIENLGLDYSVGGLSSEISVSNPENTRILTITVVDPSPLMAMQIADEVREVAGEHIQNVMNIEAVNVVDKAYLPTAKSSPNIKKYTVLGAGAGFVIMCVIFALRFILNDSIRTPDDIEKKLGISCLAVVPINPNIKKKKRK